MGKPKRIPNKKVLSAKKLIVGLTGGIASGKTTFIYLFKQFGAPVVCCDELAHRALRKKTHTYRSIVKAFGRNILDHHKKIDRKKLAALIFKNKRKRKVLEAIVHPFVFTQLFAYIKKARGVLIIDVPLLFETKFEQHVDRTIVIWCRPEEQMRRLIKRDHLSPSQARARIKSQMPLTKKKKMADWVIDSTDLRSGIYHAHTIWHTMVAMIHNKH